MMQGIILKENGSTGDAERMFIQVRNGALNSVLCAACVNSHVKWNCRHVSLHLIKPRHWQTNIQDDACLLQSNATRLFDNTQLLFFHYKKCVSYEMTTLSKIINVNSLVICKAIIKQSWDNNTMWTYMSLCFNNSRYQMV